MVSISAADVAKLRKMTGAGMMDCKNALQESEGDFEKAIETIRKKGQAVANKRADREASEGVVLAGTSDDAKFGALIVLNCETDFVAKNADFEKLANDILDKALEEKAENLDELKSSKIDGATIADKIIEQIGIIGEKLELSYYDNVKAEHVHSYIHPGNRLATLAGFNKSGLDTQVYKDVTMQIAAMNPIAVDKDDVRQEDIDREIEIGKEQARREGKPDNLLEKIAMGKLGKFFKENTLLNQEFVKNNKQTIRQYLESADKELTVTGFVRYTLND
ncbi:MAG: translation elongation factor Ts [Bacteroidota bacterium]|nr:translation elongation factor Ts [Bacteroidota bacterium]